MRAARYQIAVTICKLCKQGWQHGGGRSIAIEPADVARAECDAQHIGSVDGSPERATQDIPSKTRRFVLRRDGDRCTVPGCRASRFMEFVFCEPLKAPDDDDQRVHVDSDDDELLERRDRADVDWDSGYAT